MPAEVNRAGHLFARKEGEGKRFLLIGHLDTVFEADDPFQSFRRDGDVAYGPGTDDMKSGDVVIVYALKALQAAGLLADIPVVVAYSGDEEKRASRCRYRAGTSSRRENGRTSRWASSRRFITTTPTGRRSPGAAPANGSWW